MSMSRFLSRSALLPCVRPTNRQGRRLLCNKPPGNRTREEIKADWRKETNRQRASDHLRAADPVGNILFGGNMSLPVLIVVLAGFMYVNSEHSKREAIEQAKRAEQAEQQKTETLAARSDALGAAAPRLARKRQQLAYWQTREREEGAAGTAGGGATTERRMIMRLSAEIAELEADVAAEVK